MLSSTNREESLGADRRSVSVREMSLREPRQAIALSYRPQSSPYVLWDGLRIVESRLTCLDELENWIAKQAVPLSLYWGQDADLGSAAEESALSVRPRMAAFCDKPRDEDIVQLVTLPSGTYASLPMFPDGKCRAKLLPYVLSQNSALAITSDFASALVGSRQVPSASEKSDEHVRPNKSECTGSEIKSNRPSRRRVPAHAEGAPLKGQESGLQNNVDTLNCADTGKRTASPAVKSTVEARSGNSLTSDRPRRKSATIASAMIVSILGPVQDATIGSSQLKADSSTSASVKTESDSGDSLPRRNTRSSRASSVSGGLKTGSTPSEQKGLDINGNARADIRVKRSTAPASHLLNKKPASGQRTEKGLELSSTENEPLPSSKRTRSRGASTMHASISGSVGASVSPRESRNEARQARTNGTHPALVSKRESKRRGNSLTHVDVPDSHGLDPLPNKRLKAASSSLTKLEMSDTSVGITRAQRGRVATVANGVAKTKVEPSLESAAAPELKPSGNEPETSEKREENEQALAPNALTGSKSSNVRKSLVNSRRSRPRPAADSSDQPNSTSEHLEPVGPLGHERTIPSHHDCVNPHAGGAPAVMPGRNPAPDSPPKIPETEKSPSIDGARTSPVRSVTTQSWTGEKLPPIDLNEILTASESALLGIDLKDVLSLHTFMEDLDASDRAVLYELLPDVDRNSAEQLKKLFQSNMAFKASLAHYQRLLGQGTYDPSSISKERNRRRRAEGWNQQKEEQLEEHYAFRLDPQPAGVEGVRKWANLENDVLGVYQNMKEHTKRVA